MRKVPCELTLGNGGDVVVMVDLDDQGTLRVPRHALYGTFFEGVLRYRVMRPEDQAAIVQEIWIDVPHH